MLELNKENFEAEVLNGTETVIVDFYSDGCVPCQALVPFMEKMEENYGEQLKFASLNITKARRLAIGQKVLGLPAIVVYKGGEKADELVKDDATQVNIEAMIKKYL